MLPILFKIGNFPVRSYGVMLVIAFFVGLWMVRKRAPRFHFDPTKVADAAFWSLILGVLGARVVFILQDLPYYLAHTNELISIQFQGLTSFGGFLFGFLYLLWWSKRQMRSSWDTLDLFAPAGLVGQAIGRVGCFLNGCCYGGVCPATVPWAIHVTENPGVLHHPAQIYEGLMDIAGLGIFYAFERRGLAKGQGFALFLMLQGIARFIYEFWRAGTEAQVASGEASSTYWDGLPITQAQGVAGLMVICGVAIFIARARAGTVRQEIPV